MIYNLIKNSTLELIINGVKRQALCWRDVKYRLRCDSVVDDCAIRNALVDYLENDNGFFYGGYLVNRNLGEERNRT